MGLKQISLVGVGVILVAAIFLFGRTRFPEGKMSGMQKGSEHAGNENQPKFDFSSLLTLAKKTLNADQLDSVTALNRKLDSVANDKEKKELLTQLAETWTRTGNLIVGANYYEQVAVIEPSKKNWEQTAERYFLGMQNTSDSLARYYAAEKAISSFDELIRIDSSNTNYKVSQALCYIDGKGDVMSGVVMLKGVEKTDPDNETMNLTLGRLAVVSGQYDKAIARLEKLVQRHPDNAEGFLHLGEAYRAVGKKEAAVSAFEKCKSLLKNTEAKNQLDNIIHQTKNS